MGNNKFVGVLGLDINLEQINALINTLQFGDTGYFVLAESNGTILSESHTKEHMFKNISELEDTAYQIRTIAAVSEELSASADAISTSITPVNTIALDTKNSMDEAIVGIDGLSTQALSLN